MHHSMIILTKDFKNLLNIAFITCELWVYWKGSLSFKLVLHIINLIVSLVQTENVKHRGALLLKLRWIISLLNKIMSKKRAHNTYIHMHTNIQYIGTLQSLYTLHMYQNIVLLLWLLIEKSFGIYCITWSK